MTAVVCLHGLGRMPADWDGVRGGLSHAVGGGAVHAPQLPRERDAALAAARSAVVAAGGAPVLVGHSMGAVLALRLAASAEHPLRALVLTNGFFPPARDGRTTLATAADYAAHRVAFVRAAVGGRVTGRVPTAAGGAAASSSTGRVPTAAGGAAAGSSTGRVPASTGLGVLVGLALRRGGWERLTAAVTVPVLVVHAPDDHHVPIAFARAAARAHGWTLRELPTGGHHTHVTEPGAWLAAVAPWLRATPV